MASRINLFCRLGVEALLVCKELLASVLGMQHECTQPSLSRQCIGVHFCRPDTVLKDQRPLIGDRSQRNWKNDCLVLLAQSKMRIILALLHLTRFGCGGIVPHTRRQ